MLRIEYVVGGRLLAKERMPDFGIIASVLQALAFAQFEEPRLFAWPRDHLARRAAISDPFPTAN